MLNITRGMHMVAGSKHAPEMEGGEQSYRDCLKQLEAFLQKAPRDSDKLEFAKQHERLAKSVMMAIGPKLPQMLEQYERGEVFEQLQERCETFYGAAPGSVDPNRFLNAQAVEVVRRQVAVAKDAADSRSRSVALEAAVSAFDSLAKLPELCEEVELKRDFGVQSSGSFESTERPKSLVKPGRPQVLIERLEPGVTLERCNVDDVPLPELAVARPPSNTRERIFAVAEPLPSVTNGHVKEPLHADMVVEISPPVVPQEREPAEDAKDNGGSPQFPKWADKGRQMAGVNVPYVRTTEGFFSISNSHSAKEVRPSAETT